MTKPKIKKSIPLPSQPEISEHAVTRIMTALTRARALRLRIATFYRLPVEGVGMRLDCDRFTVSYGVNGTNYDHPNLSTAEEFWGLVLADKANAK